MSGYLITQKVCSNQINMSKYNQQSDMDALHIQSQQLSRLQVIVGEGQADRLASTPPVWFSKGSKFEDDNFIFGKPPPIEIDTVDSSTLPKNVRKLALFPLDDGAVFPTGQFPMHIFVMKFRQMMNDVQKSDKILGVIMSDGNGGICEVGTIIENTHRELLSDGRQICFNDCKNRFRVTDILQTEPYIIALVNTDVEDKDVIEAKSAGNGLPYDLCEMESSIWITFNKIMNVTNQLLEDQNETVTVSAISIKLAPKDLTSTPMDTVSYRMQRLQHASEFSFAVCDMLDLSELEKQSLLQCVHLRDRLKEMILILEDFQRLLVEAGY
eukprot:gene1913-3712_t